MTQRCLKVLARVLLVLAAVATTVGVPALGAQSTGKIQGYIRDVATQQPIANARVVITGTSYSAAADARGYYFIENVPAGVYSARAAYVGYKPHELAGLRVLAGQTMIEDFTLESSPVTLTDITVTAARNPLVPRDAVTTKQAINGDAVQKLPVDRIAQALALQPGVVQVSVCGTNQPCAPTISVRGGRIDQNVTYIDGVPVQNGIHTGASAVTGAPVLTVATNGLEEASITTGASSASFGNAQAGVINISTRNGGSTFSGNIGYETGLAGLSYYGQGLNTFRASFGGPIGKHLNFFLSGNVEGNNSTNGANHGWLYPSYAAVGVDTTYTVPFAPKAGTGTVVDSAQVSVYNYAVVAGGCGNTAATGGYLGANNTAMATNYGVACHANQLYAAPNTNYFTTDKLTYSFGQGSRLSLSYLFSGNQNRGTLADGSNFGNVTNSSVATLNWNQTLIKEANHQLTLDAYISRQWNNGITAPLTAASEQATRGSTGGFILHKLQFIYDQNSYPVDSTLIVHILSQTANHRIGITDPKNPTQYNGVPGYSIPSGFTAFNNYGAGISSPDGVPYGAGGGGGDNNGLAYNHENRWVGIANIDFQADRYNRIKVGGQYTAYDIQNYTAGAIGSGVFPFTYTNGHLTPGGKPVAYNGYAEDRIDLGDVVLVAGVRYDYYATKAWRWNAYPEISTRPGFTPDSLFCPVGATPSYKAKCAMIQDPSYSYVSPHMQVSFPVTDKTNFRLSYAQNVQAPDFGLSYALSTCDINIGCANSRSRFGQALDFGKTVTFEFGARHAFSDDMVLDVSVYNNDIIANPSFGFQHPIDPISGQAAIVYEVTNTDFGNTRGLDVRLDRRIGNYFNGSLTYSFQDSKNTGTDPFSYLGFFEPLGGFTGDPPTSALPTALSRPHSLTALFNISLPADWEKGSILGTILKRTGFNVVARLASGQAYTRCDPLDANSIGVISGNPCGTLAAISNFNADRLPMQKQFDMRVTKDFQIGKYQFTGYIDARNVLNLQNITSVWAQTGTTSSGLAFGREWSSDSSGFATYARATSEYNAATGAITLPSSIAACGKVIAGTSSYAPACYYMIRSEQRFGNGDGVYTLAEQRVASDAHTQYANGVWARNSGARTIRLGFDVNF